MIGGSLDVGAILGNILFAMHSSAPAAQGGTSWATVVVGVPTLDVVMPTPAARSGEVS